MVGVGPPEGVTADTSTTTEDNTNLRIYAGNFLEKFYWRFNSSPRSLYLMYAEKCTRTMTYQIGESTIEIETSVGIKDFWENNEQTMQCQVGCFVVKRTDNLTLILVNGYLEGFGTKSCNYVEVFLLSESGQISKDILFVFTEGKPIQMPNSIAHVMPMEQLLHEIPEAENVNSARRHSSRIRDRSQQISGKKSVTTGLEAARNLRDKKKSGSLTIIPEAESMLNAGIFKPSGKEHVEKASSLTFSSEAKSMTDAGSRKLNWKERVEKTTSLIFSSEAKSMTDAGSQKLKGKEPVEPISLAILYDEVMLGHKGTHYCVDDDNRMMYRKRMWDHPEKPARLKCIMDRFMEDNLFDRAVLIKHDFADVKDIVAVHGDVYAEFIQSLPLTAEANKKFMGFFSRDVYCSKGTRDAVFSAAGANIKACDMVFRGQFKKAFAVVRPPGHHVSKDEAEGFCFVNNLAVGAKYLLRHHKVKRIFAIDWDVHHGNGSQDLFYESDEVFFFSTYNMSLDYPNTSRQGSQCIGKGKGAGFNVNVPLASGFGDSDLLYVWNELLIPLLKAFNPEITLISCGFDAAQGDPLGNANVTPPCFGTLIDKVDTAGNGKIVLTLEGGYDLANLAECSSYCARALVGDRSALLDESKLDPLCKGTVETVMNLKRFLSHFWWDVFKKPRLCAK